MRNRLAVALALSALVSTGCGTDLPTGTSDAQPGALFEYAADLDACQDDLSYLYTLTDGTYSFKNEKDKDGLLRKVNEASAKLTEGKPADAVQKLTDYRTKVYTLQTQRKPGIDYTDAQTLLGAVDTAISCIQPVP